MFREEWFRPPWPGGSGPACRARHRLPRRSGGRRREMGVPALVLSAALLALACGAFLGWFLRSRVQRPVIEKERVEAGEDVPQTRRESEDQKRRSLLQAREEWLGTKARLEQEIRTRSREVQQAERALEERETALRDRDARLQTREQDLETREKEQERLQGDASRERDRLRKTSEDLNQRLATIPGLTTEDAS